MAIFNELSTDLMILNEKKTREEYARRSFKKKYNYEPSKEDPNIGTITDKSGKKYKVDMRKSSTMTANSVDGSNEIEVGRQMSADLFDKDSKINVDDKFFKIKGSRKGERRDAVLQHELGHQNLHNINPDNKTVDKKNRDPEVHKSVIRGAVKDAIGIDFAEGKSEEDHDARKDLYDSAGAKKYFEKSTKDKDEKKYRRNSLNTAKKYETSKNHQNAAEFEADRYAANRTSEGALKRGLRDYSKKLLKNFDDEDAKKSVRASIDDETKQRTKALKDEDMRKSKTYK